jgi:branched-chain amino acid transport system permease protein
VQRPTISTAWWNVLDKLGVDRSRWQAGDPVARRAVKVAIWLAIGLVLVVAFGAYSWTVFPVAALVFFLVVPPYKRLPFGRYVAPMALLVIAVTYPFYGGKLFGWPVFGPFPAMNTMVVMMVFVVMALGLNVVVGYAGLLDLGYVAFYAMGAYSVGWFASDQFAKRNIHFGAVGVNPKVAGIHLSIWLILAIAGILTALVGVLIGLPTLRLRGDYLAIVTLGFGEIMPQIARNGNQLFGTSFNLTGGTQGITPVDPPGFGSWINRNIGLPDNFLAPSPHTAGFLSNTINVFYWTALLLVLFTVFCSVRLRDSRLGRAWVAIREDEIAAAAMGVPLMRTKTWAYATGAFFGGIAGAFFASYKSAVFPDDFFFNISVFILCMVILGGMGNIWGVLLGACFLAYLDREGLANIGAWTNSHFGLSLDIPKYEFGIFGIILVIVMLFRPEGLIPSTRRRAEFQVGVHDKPLYDVKE